MSRKTLRRMMLVAALLAALMLTLGCAEKSTGDDDDDDGADDDDDDAAAGGVGDFDVHLNMVAVNLGSTTAPAPMTVYNGEKAAVEVEAVVVGELLAALTPFAEDAEKFTYEFIDQSEQNASSLIAYGDLAQAVFYKDPTSGELCLGWLTESLADRTLCGMENGWIVTHPVSGAFEMTSLAALNARTGDTPNLLGDMVAIQATVVAGSNTVVSGTYLKTYVQQNGWGVKVFADSAATETNQGYDGSLTTGIETFVGDELFVVGRITLHGDMIELVPKSGYHVAVLSILNQAPAPTTITIDNLLADPYRYPGVLLKLEDLRIVDVDPDDPTTDWPDYGTKAKEISIRHTSGGSKMMFPVYENTGLPGSDKPADGFDAVGVFEVDNGTGLLYPRRIEDINPTDQTLSGTMRVLVVGEDAGGAVSLAGLQAGLQPSGEDDALIPVVSLAEVAHAAGLTRNPKLLDYKIVAYDDRQPFETIIFDEMKSGVFYQGTPESAEEPDPLVNSYFWPEMGLSDIYYLRGVNRIQAYRAVEPPTEGEAEYGKGITLLINDKSFVINFEGLTRTTYEGQEAISFDLLINDQVLDMYTMSGSFTNEQIKALYHYHIVATDGSDDAVVLLNDLAGGYLIPADDPYVIFPFLGDAYRVDKVHTIDMMRFMQVNLMDDGDPIVVYLRDCPTEQADVGDGVMEDVVFFDAVLEQAGVDNTTEMYLWDFYLLAIDEFISKWDYGHGHFTNLYFRPNENRGFTDDPSMMAYGGRASTKAVYEIQRIAVPQQEPDALPVIIEGTTVYGSNPENCDGCHWKDDQYSLPVDCTDCHTVPE